MYMYGQMEGIVEQWISSLQCVMYSSINKICKNVKWVPHNITPIFLCKYRSF